MKLKMDKGRSPDLPHTELLDDTVDTLEWHEEVGGEGIRTGLGDVPTGSKDREIDLQSRLGVEQEMAVLMSSRESLTRQPLTAVRENHGQFRGDKESPVGAIFPKREPDNPCPQIIQQMEEIRNSLASEAKARSSGLSSSPALFNRGNH